MDLDKTAKRITKGGRVIDITKIGRVKKEDPEATPEDDKLKELATEHKVISEENAKLKDMLAVKTLPASEESKVEVAVTLADLRRQVASLESQLRAVTSSRNDFQNKNAELIKQVTYWKRRAEKADKQ
jgi:chromosome segregation ATPase